VQIKPADNAAQAQPENRSRGAERGSIRTAVFDLDGTLLAGDSTVAWLRMILLASWPRLVVALVTAPLWAVLVLIPASRKIGASILLWIATFGRDQDAVVRSIHTFVSHFEKGDGPIRWREEGLATLRRHLARNDRVVVVTAAPQWLAAPLLASRTDVPVLGSILTRRWNSWVVERHCFGEAKCRALQRLGYGSTWDFVYTDSMDDEPLLAAAEHGFIVNARSALIAKLKTDLQSRVSPIHWT
jgi:phosphatidylglycerophosphatase C